MTTPAFENNLVHERGPIGGGTLESGVQIGDFRIERRLGAGGMGIVYQARQVSLNRPVALKVLGQALTRSGDVTRFQREAQAAARLKHPAIAQVYFIGQDRHLCYMAMELVDGISLRRVLDRLGATATAQTSFDAVVADDLLELPEGEAVRFDAPTEATAGEAGAKHEPGAPAAAATNPYLSPQALEMRTSAAYVRRTCEVIRDAAQALVHAHEQGVVHRDIKPDNLLLDREGGVHLIDFGVARFFEDQAVTYTGQLVGTPLYMSPEQVTGRGSIDVRTDIYSLGLVFYELLTLRPPIEANNREHLLRTIVTKPLPPVSWRNAAVSVELEKIVHRATQKDPDQRYASAAELAADLDRFLSGQAVTAPPYHFRLDEREITAARPGRVTLAAFIFFVSSFFLFVAIGSFSLFLGTMKVMMPEEFRESILGEAIVGVLLVAVLAVGTVIGWGLLAGRGWARWLGVALAVLASLGSLGAAGIAAVTAVTVSSLNVEELQKKIEDLPEEKRPKLPPGAAQPEDAMKFVQPGAYGMLALFILPITAGLVLGGTAAWSLLSWPTGRWFRFARETRREHQRLRAMLAE